MDSVMDVREYDEDLFEEIDLNSNSNSEINSSIEIINAEGK